MTQYRCYLLNELGRPADSELVESPTDDQAQRQAIALLQARPGHRAIEVWAGHRKIASYAREGR